MGTYDKKEVGKHSGNLIISQWQTGGSTLATCITVHVRLMIHGGHLAESCEPKLAAAERQ